MYLSFWCFQCPFLQLWPRPTFFWRKSGLLKAWGYQGRLRLDALVTSSCPYAEFPMCAQFWSRNLLPTPFKNAVHRCEDSIFLHGTKRLSGAHSTICTSQWIVTKGSAKISTENQWFTLSAWAGRTGSCRMLREPCSKALSVLSHTKLRARSGWGFLTF